jgi:hypothetical protein
MILSPLLDRPGASSFAPLVKSSPSLAFGWRYRSLTVASRRGGLDVHRHVADAMLPKTAYFFG